MAEENARGEVAGGAAQIAKTLVNLGRDVQLIGVLGQEDIDGYGYGIASDCHNYPRLTQRWVASTRPTRRRENYTVNGESVLRTATARLPTPPEYQAAVVDAATQAMHDGSAGVLVIADYDEQSLSRDTILLILTAAGGRLPLFVTASASQLRDATYYRGAFLILRSHDAIRVAQDSSDPHPGLAEAANGSRDQETVAAAVVRRMFASPAVIVVCHDSGIVVVSTASEELTFPLAAIAADRRELADEVFIASLIFAYLSQMSAADAVRYATAALQLSTQTDVSQQTLDQTFLQQCRAESQLKQVPLSRAAEISLRLRAVGKRVAVVDGHFDHLHYGHLRLIEEASLASDLVVALVSSDGQTSIEERMRRLSDFGRVGLVVAVSDVEDAIRSIRPTFLFKGAEYQTQATPGADYVAAHGGDVRFVPMQVFE